MTESRAGGPSSSPIQAIRPTFRRRREGGGAFSQADLLRWVYIGRLTLATGIILAALFVWGQARPEETFVATTVFLTAILVTAGGFWYTHVLARDPGRNFLYGQIVFDVLAVSAIVWVTGGGQSNFVWIYILVISAGALLLPLQGGVLIGILASILYFAVIVWGHSETLTGGVLLQLGLFTMVALVTGLLGDRLRRAGLALGAVQSELRLLQMDTGEILDSIATAILTVDGDGRVAYMNPAAEGLLGLRGEEWIGEPLARVVEKAAPDLATVVRRSLEEGQALSRQRVAARRGGEDRSLGVSTTVQSGEDGPRSVTAIFQDITDLERMEALNRRNERLEAVAELSAAMAHEIKNPLSSIRSAVEQFTHPRLAGDDRERLTGMVVRESERLSRLLSDFIDFSRLQIGRVEAVDLRELVRECVSVVRQHPDATERDVDVGMTGGDGELRVHADPDLLHRAVFNLVLNAVQFSPDGGTVEVADLRTEASRGGAARVAVEDPVRVSVRDSGPGVAPQDVGRIFDPFYTTRKGGSGLGLAVVHRSVEAHDGAVLASLRPEGGSEFQIYLPAGPPEAERTEEVVG